MDDPFIEHIDDRPGIVGKAFGTIAAGGMALGLGAAKLGAKGVFNGAKLLGNGIIGGSYFMAREGGRAAISVGKALGNSLNETSGFKNPIGAMAKNTDNFLRHIVDYKPSRMVYNDATKAFERKSASMGLTKLGGAVIGGIGFVGGLSKAYDSYITKRAGTMDTRKTTNTPDINPVEYFVQHPDFSGATGDLVFALNANRRG